MSTREFIPLALPGMTPNAPPRALAQSSTDRSIETRTHGLSLRSNFVWILSGNAVYAACQWGVIVTLAKLGSSFMVGQFSLGLAIATPVLMFTNLHLRAVQATDARRSYSFGEYLWLRSALTLVGLTAIVTIVCFGDYGRQTAMVILAVAFAKGIETLSDIHYGLFQLNDRLDQSGRSMMLRGILSIIAFGTGLYVTGNLLWACTGLALVWLAALLFFDVKRGRRFLRFTHNYPKRPSRPWELMLKAMPLGVATAMAALNLSIPRYFIHARLGEDQLGIYSAIAYTTVAMIIVSDSLGHCAIPKLSRLHSCGHLAEFRALLFKLLAAGGILGIAGLALARFLGVRLLKLVYGGEYAAHAHIFVVLILAAAIYCVACMLTSAITSARCFRIQAPLYAFVVGSNALACARWIPAKGLAGGAEAMVVASIIHLTLGAAVVASLLWAPKRSWVYLQES